MKHPIDNKTYEGQGFNRYAIVEEGREHFIKRMEKDGHYRNDSSGLGLTTEDRAELAGRIWDDADAWVEKQKAKKAEKADKPEPDIDKAADEKKQPTEGTEDTPPAQFPMPEGNGGVFTAGTPASDADETTEAVVGADAGKKSRK